MQAVRLPSADPPRHAIVARGIRRNDHSPLSRIKALNYADHVLALREACAAGVTEAILLNTNNCVACATTANIFMLVDDAWWTPPLADGVIDGVVRAALLRAGSVRERTLHDSDLMAATGIVLSNSLRGAWALHSVDGRALLPLMPTI